MPPPSQTVSMNEVWTVGRLVAWASEDLRRRNVSDCPRLDAELLLGAVLKVDRVRLLVDSKRPLDPTELARFKEYVVRRRRAEPVAYILGQREFYGLPFRVDPTVLIPRPDTETLVEVALQRTVRRSLFGRAVDVCTGSGCVAISLARQRPGWALSASDLSPQAVRMARQNSLRLGTQWNLDVRVGDLLQPFSGEQFDLITANPPYIPDHEMGSLQADVRRHEPHLALKGGREGLDVLRRLVREASRQLLPGGVLAVEVGAGQAPRVQRGLQAYGFADVTATADYGGIERVVSGRWP